MGRVTYDIAYVLKGSGISKEDFDSVLSKYSTDVKNILGPIASENLTTIDKVEDVLKRLEEAISGELEVTIPQATLDALASIVGGAVKSAFPAGFLEALAAFSSALGSTKFDDIKINIPTYTDISSSIQTGIAQGMEGMRSAVANLTTAINTLSTAIDHIKIEVKIPEISTTEPEKPTVTPPKLPDFILQYQPNPQVPEEWTPLYNDLSGLGTLTNQPPESPVNLQNNLIIGQDLAASNTKLGTTPETTSFGKETVSFGQAYDLLKSYLQKNLYSSGTTYEQKLSKSGVSLDDAVSKMLAGSDWSDLFSGKNIAKNTKFDSRFEGLIKSLKNISVDVGGASIESSQLAPEFKEKTTYTENKLSNLDFTSAAARFSSTAKT